jgi:threonine dehydrogenase-like Zn-dependent dehydrogenase
MAVLDSYLPAIRLIADGMIQVEPLITHQLLLNAYPDAFEALRRGDGLKIQLLL